MKNKSPYIFHHFDLYAYKNENKAAIFMKQNDDLTIENFVAGLNNVKSELLQYPDCKELKKALKLYKLLDKYAK